jgi:hypothetical protein
MVAGTTRAVDADTMREFQDLLTRTAPGRAVAAKALELGIAAAQSPRSAGVIGQSWSSGVIFNHPRDPIWVQYHTPRVVKNKERQPCVDATGPSSSDRAVEHDGGDGEPFRSQLSWYAA